MQDRIVINLLVKGWSRCINRSTPVLVSHRIRSIPTTPYTIITYQHDWL
jgi:hypothetical protein